MPVLGVVASSFRAAAALNQVLVVGLQNSPGEATWSWDAGFGTKYAAPSSGVGIDITAGYTFSRAGNAVFMGDVTDTYRWSNSGYGTVYSAPTEALLSPFNADWGPSDAFVVVSGDPAQRDLPIAYTWSSSGYGTRFSTAPWPSVTTQTTYDVEVSPNGNYVALTYRAGGSTNPRIRTWRFNVSSGWGTALSAPSGVSWGSNAGNTAYSVDFTPSQDAIAISYFLSPFVHVWPFSDGYGTKYSNPTTLPAGIGYKVRFSPSADSIALSHATSPFVSVYPWSSGFGSKYANPATLPTGAGYGVSFSATGDAIAVAQFGVTPAVSVYAWSSGFGTRYADAAESTTSGARVLFSEF